MEVIDSSGQFWKGVIFGDFVEDEEVDGYVLVGQIASGFVPVVADGRDVIANVSKGDFLMAILSGAGFFPGAGDAAKSLGDLGQVIAKLADDTPTIARLLIKTADEHPYLVRLFGESAIVEEALEEALGNPQITKESYEKLAKIAGKADNGRLIVPNIGFNGFNDLKKYLGSAGEGKAWHHIVEQSQIGKRANFASKQVNNVNNIIAIPSGTGSIHEKISTHYSSKFEFTNGLTVRDWLASKSFDEQFEYGKNLLEEYGEVIATEDGWIFKPYE